MRWTVLSVGAFAGSAIGLAVALILDDLSIIGARTGIAIGVGSLVGIAVAATVWLIGFLLIRNVERRTP